MRIHAETDRCIASGMCLLAAPEIFDQDDDGYVVVLEAEPAPEHHDAVRTAEHQCPMSVISFTA
jgi:ferredoxin